MTTASNLPYPETLAPRPSQAEFHDSLVPVIYCPQQRRPTITTPELQLSTLLEIKSKYDCLVLTLCHIIVDVSRK
jgi:hypothetical protein